MTGLADALRPGGFVTARLAMCLLCILPFTLQVTAGAPQLGAEDSQQVARDATVSHVIEDRESGRRIPLVRGKAEPLLAKAVALRPSDLAAQVNLGSVLPHRGKLAETEEHSRSAPALEPRSIAARRGVVMCRQQAGRHLEALRMINEVLQ